MHLSIEIAVEHDAWTDHLAREARVGAAAAIEALVERAIAAALAEAARMTPAPTIADGAELSILLADDAFIRTLNAQWRGKNTATNVLSFLAAGPARAVTIGDIVVAYGTSALEAAERGTPLADHLSHLLIHGVLHLLGYDHETDAEAEAMEALEGRTLSALGIASPYESVVEPAATEASAPARSALMSERS